MVPRSAVSSSSSAASADAVQQRLAPPSASASAHSPADDAAAAPAETVCGGERHESGVAPEPASVMAKLIGPKLL